MVPLLIPVLVWTLWGHTILQQCTPDGCLDLPASMAVTTPHRLFDYATEDECLDAQEDSWQTLTSINTEIEQKLRAVSPTIWLGRREHFWCVRAEEVATVEKPHTLQLWPSMPEKGWSQ